MSRRVADARVLAATVLLVDGRLPRTAALLRAGLVDWSKVQLLVTRVGVGVEPALAAVVEAEVIPDADLALAQRLDTAQPGIESSGEVVLPWVTRATVPGVARAVEGVLVAVDAQEAARRGGAGP
jgi:hypothetical protein